jgi:micrococcal nuclease
MNRRRTQYRPTVRVLTACMAAPAAVVLLSGCNPLIAPPNSETASEAVSVSSGVVDRVIDGDTIEVRPSIGGDPIRVRILGIDTPETVDPDTDMQCWGPEASAWAHEQLDNATVTLASDPVADDTDRYGRALRYVVLPDGSNYSTVAAGAGMARAYTYEGQQLSEAANIVAAQSTAQHGGAGLWGPPCHGRTVPN